MDNENDILKAIEEAEEIYYLIKRIKKTIENKFTIVFYCYFVFLWLFNFWRATANLLIIENFNKISRMFKIPNLRITVNVVPW